MLPRTTRPLASAAGGFRNRGKVHIEAKLRGAGVFIFIHLMGSDVGLQHNSQESFSRGFLERTLDTFASLAIARHPASTPKHWAAHATTCC